MSKPAFTPGPWTDNGRDIVGKNGKRVAFSNGSMAHGSVTNFPQAKANAQLAIASADLFMACQRLLTVMKKHGLENDPNAEFARAALDKATGAAK